MSKIHKPNNAIGRQEETKLEDLEVVDQVTDEERLEVHKSDIDEETTLHEVDVLNLVKNLGLQQRYWFYCHEWKLSNMVVDDVYPSILEEVSVAIRPIEDEEIIVKTADEESIYFWKILDVDYGIALCQSIEKADHQEEIDIRDLHLIWTNETDRQVAESRALAIHMYSFFTNIIHRSWDRFSDAADVNFEPILRRRLNLFGLDCDDTMRHLHFRNDRELTLFNNILTQLQQLHEVLQKISQDEEKVFERVYNDYLESYSICKVHGSRLQKMEEELWQQYQILKKGKSQIVRRKNGPRASNKTVYHLVGHQITAIEIKKLNLPDDTIIKTYDDESFGNALHNSFEDDYIILFPGVYSFDEHLFHESLTIRGAGERPEDVVIQSDEGEGYFIFCDSENVCFENLTLEAKRNFEGALVVNGGNCSLIDVTVSCDMVTRGLIVRPFAVCKVHNINILGDHTASVSLENAAVFIESGGNTYSAEIRLDELAPAQHKTKDTPITPRPAKKYITTLPSEIGTKILSPRADPSEGAGDTFAA